MFDAGFSELVLIFVIGLLVLGPERLPKVAARVGDWVGQARRMTRLLRRQIEEELEFREIYGKPAAGRTAPRGATRSKADAGKQDAPPAAAPQSDGRAEADDGGADAPEASPPRSAAEPAGPAADASEPAEGTANPPKNPPVPQSSAQDADEKSVARTPAEGRAEPGSPDGDGERPERSGQSAA